MYLGANHVNLLENPNLATSDANNRDNMHPAFQAFWKEEVQIDLGCQLISRTPQTAFISLKLGYWGRKLNGLTQILGYIFGEPVWPSA